MSVNLSNASAEFFSIEKDGSNVRQQAVVEFNFNGKTYEAEIMERHQSDGWYDRKSFNAKGRLYIHTYYAGYDAEVSRPIDFELFGVVPEYTTRGEDVANDKAWDSYNRNWTKVSKAAAFAALEKVGVEFKKASFSRRAGCSCPCSPGWIVGETTNMNLWVTIQPVGTHAAELEAKAAKEAAKVMAIAGCI
jgi:hypothetical protein